MFKYGVEIFYHVFNAVGSTKDSWMTASRELVGSSNYDLANLDSVDMLGYEFITCTMYFN